MAAYLRLSLWKHASLALRAEVFEGRDGTLTPEFRPTPHMVVRWDLRWDSSSRGIFEDGDLMATRTSHHQVTTSLNLIYKF